MTAEQVEQYRAMWRSLAPSSAIVRVMQCSPATVKKALAATLDG